MQVLERLDHRQWLAARLLAQELLQRHTLDELRGQEQRAVRLARAVHGDHVGMGVEARCDLHLAGEPLAEVGVGRVVVRQHLERRLATQGDVGRRVDDREATGVDDVVDPVALDEVTDLKHRGVLRASQGSWTAILPARGQALRGDRADDHIRRVDVAGDEALEARREEPPCGVQRDEAQALDPGDRGALLVVERARRVHVGPVARLDADRAPTGWASAPCPAA